MEDLKDRCEFSSLKVEAKAWALPVVRAYVTSVAERVGFGPSEIEEIGRAADQAADNVVRHAFEPHEQGAMEIISERAFRGVMISIRDKGIPFEPDEPVKDNLGRGDQKKGIPLMFDLMDEVGFKNLGREGKEVTLVKYLKEGDHEAYDLACKPTTPATGETFHGRALTVRLLKASEAFLVSRAIYKSYGDTYFYEHVYYPDRVKRLLETGRQVSAGAFDESGNMVGHCALMEIIRSASSAELGQAVVDPGHRGSGSLKKLTDFLILEAVNMGLTGLSAQAVTTHRFSQKILYGLGFYHCGLLLAHAPEGLAFRGLREGPSESRESKEIMYRYIVPRKGGVIYPPPKREAFITRMFENIGEKPTIAAPGLSLPRFDNNGAHIEVESHAFIPKGFALIKIKTVGREIVEEIKKKVRRLCLNKIKAIGLFLDLSDPMTYHLGPKMEELGFIVTGIMPGTEIGDAMVLQYFNNLKLDFDSIDLYSEEARRTLDYIRRNMPR